MKISSKENRERVGEIIWPENRECSFKDFEDQGIFFTPEEKAARREKSVAWIEEKMGGEFWVNAGGMARELAAQDSESTTDLNG